jgi:hypothetical protein
MKISITRETRIGRLSVEEELADPAYLVVVARRVRAALDQAEAELVPRPTIKPEPEPEPEPGPRRDPDPRYVPCVPPPAGGRELWVWAFNVGCCRRVIELGRACGLPSATRRDVYRWSADDVAHVYHEIQAKPRGAAGRRGRRPND